MFQSKKNEIVEGYLEFVKEVLEFWDEAHEFKVEQFERMHIGLQVVQAFIFFSHGYGSKVFVKLQWKLLAV